MPLYLPDLTGKDWEQAIEEAEGNERTVLTSQWQFVQALGRLTPQPTTPPKIAWLIFWTRAYALTSAALGVWERRAPTELRVLERVSFELAANFQFIAEPVASGVTARGAATLRDRLTAYCAWCLWNDAEVYRHLLEPSNLEHVFDPEPKRRQRLDLGLAADAWTAITGQDLEVVSDQEAEFDRVRGERHFRRRLDQFEGWLQDSALGNWPSKLRARKWQSFFHLVEGPRRGLKGHLTAQDMGFSYAAYKSGSGAIHSCSLEAALHIGKDSLVPEFIDLAGSAEASLKTIVVTSKLILLPLTLIAGILSRPETAGA